MLATDLLLPHNQSDITKMFKDKQEMILIDIVVPGDSRIA